MVVPTAAEKRCGLGFAAAAVPLFAAGCTVCFLVFPKIMAALLGPGFTPRGVAVQLPLDTFLVFYLRMMAVFGVSFVLPLFLLVASALGIISGARTRASWRVMVMATPLCALYFAAVVVACVNDERRLRRKKSAPLNSGSGRALQSGRR